MSNDVLGKSRMAFPRRPLEIIAEVVPSRSAEAAFAAMGKPLHAHTVSHGKALHRFAALRHDAAHLVAVGNRRLFPEAEITVKVAAADPAAFHFHQEIPGTWRGPGTSSSTMDFAPW